MGRTTKRLRLRACWDTEWDMYEYARGLYLNKPWHLATVAAIILRDLPGPVDKHSPAG